jgi:hypothetical protein
MVTSIVVLASGFAMKHDLKFTAYDRLYAFRGPRFAARRQDPRVPAQRFN